MSEELTQPIDAVQEQGPWDQRYLHIDEFLDANYEIISRPGLAYAHFLFSHFRKPAVDKCMHDAFMRKFKLFVDYEGKTWRVTGASRMGDIWLTSDYNRDHGYDRRVDLVVSKFSNWRDEADRPLTWNEQMLVGKKFYGLDTVKHGEQIPKRCNRYTNMLALTGVPNKYLDTTPEQREYLSSLKKEDKS